MSVTITWIPNTEADIQDYDIQRAPDVDGSAGTFVDVTTITHDLSGANYDADSNRFFYADADGSLTHWYRLRSGDADGNKSGWSNPFQPSTSTTPPPFPNTVQLDEDYGGEDALQYTDPDGEPVDEAQVRVYKKVDYDLALYDAAVGVTTTDATGGWVNPVTVEAGFTYTIEFFKPNAFGPDTTEVVVP
jgi:hypothetical protein